MRIIMHLDMDAFFASVEERDNSRFKGLPIAVGADPKDGKGRGVVSTANYAARKYGIKSALPISRAWNFSQQAKRAGKPEVIFLGVNMEKYMEESKKIMKYLSTKTDSFQPASIDEAYLDVSNLKSQKKAEELAKEIKAYIKDKEGLTCSIGIGPNKLIAKIASDEQKPDGLTVVSEKKVQEFLDPKSVRVIPGIGPKAEQALLKMGIRTIKDLRQKNKGELVETFGKRGENMYASARGMDDRSVEVGGDAKSIGEQTTFQEDTLDPKILIKAFKNMARRIHISLGKRGYSYKTIVVTVRFANFTTKTRSFTLDSPKRDLKTLETESLNLLLPFLDSRENPKRQKIRLIGIRAEKLSGEK